MCCDVDLVEDVPDVTEADVQTAAGRSRSEPAGSVGDGVQTLPGLYGTSQLLLKSRCIRSVFCAMTRYLDVMTRFFLRKEILFS